MNSAEMMNTESFFTPSGDITLQRHPAHLRYSRIDRRRSANSPCNTWCRAELLQLHFMCARRGSRGWALGRAPTPGTEFHHSKCTIQYYSSTRLSLGAHPWEKSCIRPCAQLRMTNALNAICARKTLGGHESHMSNVCLCI